ARYGGVLPLDDCSAMARLCGKFPEALEQPPRTGLTRPIQAGPKSEGQPFVERPANTVGFDRRGFSGAGVINPGRADVWIGSHCAPGVHSDDHRCLPGERSWKPDAVRIDALDQRV